MKAKCLKLIRMIYEFQPCTSNLLANQLGVSVRSIKNYVHEINEEYPTAIFSSQKGYTIDNKIAKSILDKDKHQLPQTSDERSIYLLNQLLKHHHEVVNLYDLCDEMFISLSTLKNELQKIKRKVAKFDLQLLLHGDEVSIIGLEKNKRKLLSTLLYDESNINFINFSSLQNNFVEINIDYIKNTILEIFSEYHYYINDYSLINLVLHITVAIERIRDGNYNTQEIKDLPAVRLHEYELANKIAKKLETYFQIVYSDAEIYEMTLLIISRATTIDYKSINSVNLEKFIGNETLYLVKELIQSIYNYYYIDLNESEFLIRFALHIKNLLVRSKNNYFSKNPLTDRIKKSCPLIYDVSVYLSSIIKDKTGVNINDDEIAYIAFHLGSTLEAQKNLTDKITAILYCPNYYDMNLKIIDALKHYFSNELLIANVLTDESEFTKLNNIDLIISTIPISTIMTIPSIQINLFLTDKDRNNLSEKLNNLHRDKKQKEFEEYLRGLMIPELFEKNSTFLDQVSCIDYMVNKFIQHGYVDERFREEIYLREKLSSTAFGNFAIPHAMKMNAYKTGINIIISDTPIQWNGQLVNLVLMLCFNAQERYIFNEIFDPLTIILSDPENMKKIINSSTYEEFINNIVNFL